MIWTVAALYRFVALDDLGRLQAATRRVCEAAEACGTILIAPEGVNGTIAAEGNGLDAVLAALDDLFGIRQGELKLSTASQRPFTRLKVRLKKEIITLRAPEADPSLRVGTYVEPEDWNALLADPDVLLVDTRNVYETAVGSFRGAVDPGLGTFTEFKDFAARRLDPAVHRKVAMFCTGGIRCEKASAYLMARGFAEVFHLKGGILKYLDVVPAEESLWQGACYVFDKRVAVEHGLGESDWDRCFGCGAPLSPDDLTRESYEKGVSCRHCRPGLTAERAAGLRMRQMQIDAADAAPAAKPSKPRV